MTPPFFPAYRLRVYAPRSVDQTEQTVLTPRAGALHSDPFQVTTLAAVAGYKPYLMAYPTGRTGLLDILSKRTDVGQMTFRIGDIRIPGQSGQAARWLSQFFGNAVGSYQVLGLRAQCDESLDGGVTWNASGLPFWTGRCQTLNSADKVNFDLAVNDMSEDLKMLTFVAGRPGAAVQSYAGSFSLMPVGVSVPYGLLVPPPPLTGAAQTPLIALFGTQMNILLDASAQATRYDNLLTEELLKAALPMPSLLYRPTVPNAYIIPSGTGTGLVASLKHTSGANTGLTGFYYVTSFQVAQRQDGTSYLVSFGIRALDDPTAPSYLALPAAAVTVNLNSTIRDILADATQPVLVNDVHPVQLIKDIASGAHGWLYKAGEVTPGTTVAAALSSTGSQTVTPASMAGILNGATLTIDTVPSGKRERVVVTAVTGTTFTATFAQTHAAGFPVYTKNVGDPKKTVPVAATPFTALIADLSFPVARLYNTIPGPASDVIEQDLCVPYSVGYFFDGAGQLNPVDLRAPSAAPALTITDADVVVDQSFTWQLDRAAVIQRVEAKYYYELLLGPLPNPTSRGQTLPKVADCLLKPLDALLEVLDVGAADIGDQIATIDGVGYRYQDNEVIQNRARADYMVGMLARAARDLTQPVGRGEVRCALTLRRTANTNPILPGTLVSVQVSWLPDPYTGLRGGARVMRCVQLQPQGLTYLASFVDYGQASGLTAPTLGTMTLASAYAVALPVTLDANGDPVELQMAVTSTAVGTHPPDGDPSWHGFTFYGNAFVLRVSTTVTLYGGAAGARIWARVRSVPGATATVTQPSAWQYSNSVDTTGITVPSGLAVGTIGATSAIVSWTPGDTNAWTELALAQPSGQPWVVVKNLPPGTTSYTLQGLTAAQLVGVQVRHTDLVGGFSAAVSTTFTTSGTDPILPPPPRPFIPVVPTISSGVASPFVKV